MGKYFFFNIRKDNLETFDAKKVFFFGISSLVRLIEYLIKKILLLKNMFIYLLMKLIPGEGEVVYFDENDADHSSKGINSNDEQNEQKKGA